MEKNCQESGFILINKPVGITSHDVVNKLRKITGIKKIGHAGTLDPAAGGCLFMAVGREATRQISRFVKLDKEYVAEINLSAVTDTFDRQGKIIKRFAVKEISAGKIKKVLKGFLGGQKQVPPMFCAKKINGKKLYELARSGKKIARRSNEIEIFKIKMFKYKYPKLRIGVKCSSGTYIRSLAFDIGKKLGVGGYLDGLERTSIGGYKIKQAVDLKNINKNNWRKFLFD